MYQIVRLTETMKTNTHECHIAGTLAKHTRRSIVVKVVMHNQWGKTLKIYKKTNEINEAKCKMCAGIPKINNVKHKTPEIKDNLSSVQCV